MHITIVRWLVKNRLGSKFSQYKRDIMTKLVKKTNIRRHEKQKKNCICTCTDIIRFTILKLEIISNFKKQLLVLFLFLVLFSHQTNKLL